MFIYNEIVEAFTDNQKLIRIIYIYYAIEFALLKEWFRYSDMELIKMILDQ